MFLDPSRVRIRGNAHHVSIRSVESEVAAVERKAPGQIVLAGLTATLVMSGVQAMAPLMGVSRMNIAAMLGSMLGGSVPLGWLLHLVLGSIVWAAIVLGVAYGGQAAGSRSPAAGLHE